jgi:hypothetical protein
VAIVQMDWFALFIHVSYLLPLLRKQGASILN